MTLEKRVCHAEEIWLGVGACAGAWVDNLSTESANTFSIPSYNAVFPHILTIPCFLLLKLFPCRAES